jgi:hypothetical protein
MVPKGKAKMGYGEVQDTVEHTLGATECQSENVEVQWNIYKKCVLDTMSDLDGKVDRKARKPWIIQEMMSKMDEQRTWMNVNKEEGKKNLTRMGNELKSAKHKAMKEYFESTCDIMELPRTGCYDLIYTKMKELDWNENHGIQNICTEDPQGNIQ